MNKVKQQYKVETSPIQQTLVIKLEKLIEKYVQARNVSINEYVKALQILDNHMIHSKMQ